MLIGFFFFFLLLFFFLFSPFCGVCLCANTKVDLGPFLGFFFPLSLLFLLWNVFVCKIEGGFGFFPFSFSLSLSFGNCVHVQIP